MTKQTRKFLTTLRQQFRTSNGETKEQIWHILTALRGPDDENYDLKNATTGLIRKAVFGNIELTLAIVSKKDYTHYVDRRLSSSGHFASHAAAAFEALGLKWNEVNTPKTKKKVKK
jgi:hypothetical protein